MWKGAPKSSFLKAIELRKNETEAEKIIWEKLKNNKIKNLKFRRQHPISIYIADFYCHQLKLVIEIDGEYHWSKEQIIKDKERTDILNFNGLEIIRFTNNEVLNNINWVMEKIIKKIDEIENSNFPNPKGS